MASQPRQPADLGRSPGHSVTNSRVKRLEQGNGRSLDFINGFDFGSTAVLKWPPVRLVAYWRLRSF